MIHRLWKRAGYDKSDYRSGGIELFPGSVVKFNSTFHSVANDVRHLEETFDGTPLRNEQNIPDLEKLALDQFGDSTACDFLVRLSQKFGSYEDLQERLIDNARSML